MVLIVGAGMAGVAAAYWLRRWGIPSTVLEGRHRLGGRIWTSHRWPDEPVDLGASWLTHAEHSPLVRLANEFGIRSVNATLRSITLREADGRKLSAAEVAGLFALCQTARAQVRLNAARRAMCKLPDVPLEVELASVIAQWRLSPATRRSLGFFVNLTIAEPSACNLQELSLYHWDRSLVFADKSDWILPAGYVQVVERLASGVDVRFGHDVTAIEYGRQGVCITTRRGVFRAAYAIVTLPLGVLQSGRVAFSPPLPAWKRSAIQRLGFGLADKFYLRFPRVFWDPEPDCVGRIAGTLDGQWSTWINMYKYSRDPDRPLGQGKPTLLVFNRTEHAQHLERMSDVQVVDAAMAVLRREYGRSIPDPLGMQRSRWGMDPFSLGTLPHIPPGASGNDFDLLAAPVAGRLFFAGDSTHRQLPGLVLGAYSSGQREAQQVRDLS